MSALHQELEALREEKARLSENLEKLEKRVGGLARRAEWQEGEIARLRRLLYGRRSEKNPPGLDPSIPDLFGNLEPATKEEIREETKEPREEKRPRSRRRSFPKSLPRVEKVHDVPDSEKICPDCGEMMEEMGRDTSEQLNIVPLLLYILVHVRPKYGCPKCRNRVVQAPMPSQPVPRGMMAAGLLAYLIIGKYADHIPLCRMERIFKRCEIELSRKRMCDSLLACYEFLFPLIRMMRDRLVLNHLILGDETPLNLQEPGRCHRAYLWGYVGHGEAPYTVYDFREGRGAEGPGEILGGYKGCLLSDGYSVYSRIARDMPAITHAACWVHARRKFVEARDLGDARAGPMIAWIASLYAVEKEVRDKDPAERLLLRQARSAPIIGEMKQWLDNTLHIEPGSRLGQAIDYTLQRWEQLTVFLRDDRVPLDNNETERALRNPVIGRKNWLFVGSPRGGEMAAGFFTLIASAIRHGHNPYLYIKHLLETLPDWPINRLEELLPDLWKPPQDIQASLAP